MPHDITFQMEVFVLLGYAQIAATLSGFIGVVFVFGERSQGRLSVHDASAIFHFMFAGLGALFISLVTALSLVCFPGNEDLIWRLANGVGALMHLGGGGRLVLETMRGETSLRGGPVVSTCGLVAGVFSLLSSAGYLSGIGNFVFLLATSWTLGVTVVSFVSLLMSGRASE